MLVNLSDVLTSEGYEGRQMTKEVPLEMTVFQTRQGSAEILEKSPVCFTFTNIQAGKARIEGKVSLTFRAVCDRCLEEMPVVLDLSFDRLAVSPGTDPEEVDDLSFMEGYQLNVETFVYNEVLGSWPVKILCREDCRGLCLKCGRNLNTGDCGCDRFVPDPRMAAIQDIFNASKEV